MKLFFYCIFCVALLFLAFQLYRLVAQERGLERDLKELMQKTELAKKENGRVQSELNALKNPANIERELRRAGYAAPGEKVFIIVPKRQ